MKRLVVAGALALGLLAASPGAAAASTTWCTWDPLVLVVTPGGHLVAVYDSVWTPSLLNLGAFSGKPGLAGGRCGVQRLQCCAR